MVDTFDLVVACDLKRGIGKDNALPWRLPGDMKRFKEITTATPNDDLRNVVVMGRKTWDSIPKKFRPLPGRINIILTRSPDYLLGADDSLAAHSLDQALRMIPAVDACTELYKAKQTGGAELFARLYEGWAGETIRSVTVDAPDDEAGFLLDAMSMAAGPRPHKCYVIGGAEVYAQAIQDPRCELIYLTEVKGEFDCDVFFPEYKENFQLIDQSEPHRDNDIEYCFKVYKRKS